MTLWAYDDEAFGNHRHAPFMLLYARRVAAYNSRAGVALVDILHLLATGAKVPSGESDCGDGAIRLIVYGWRVEASYAHVTRKTAVGDLGIECVKSGDHKRVVCISRVYGTDTIWTHELSHTEGVALRLAV